MLVIAAAFGVVAIVKGQDIHRVGLDGRIEFYSRNGTTTVDEDAVRNRQPEIEEQVSQLERSAQQQGGASSPSQVVDFSGSWNGAGLVYVIEQYGSSAVITEQGAYGVTAYGAGTVSGAQFSFAFEAFDGSVGTGYLTMITGNSLAGQFTNSAFGASVEAQLTR